MKSVENNEAKVVFKPTTKWNQFQNIHITIIVATICDTREINTNQ